MEKIRSDKVFIDESSKTKSDFVKIFASVVVLIVPTVFVVDSFEIGSVHSSFLQLLTRLLFFFLF